MEPEGDSERASQDVRRRQRASIEGASASRSAASAEPSDGTSAEERSERGAEQIGTEGDSERGAEHESIEGASDRARGTEPLNPPVTSELRERTRQQLLDSFGGWSGTVISAIPLVVFVAVNATAGLRPAIWAAVLAAVLLAGYRMLRRQSVQQAVGGLFSVLVAAAIAGHTGQARDISCWASPDPSSTEASSRSR